jgi:hypothetical protein
VLAEDALFTGNKVNICNIHTLTATFFVKTKNPAHAGLALTP